MTALKPDPDDSVLRTAASWQRAHAQVLLAWAIAGEADLTGEDVTVSPDEASKKLRHDTDYLGEIEPKTVGGAREMLNVVLAIVGHRETVQDPESSCVANLPIIPILRSIRNAMETSCDARLGTWPKGDAA